MSSVETKRCLVGFDEFLVKAACWKHWLNKLASSETSDTCVLAVARYNTDVYSQLEHFFDFPPRVYHMKELWMLANKEQPASRLVLSKLKVISTTVLMSNGWHQSAHFIVPDAACVADLQWLAFKRTALSDWMTPKFASPHQVRVETRPERCELSMLSYDEAPSKFPHWKCMHTTHLYVSAYTDSAAASEQQATLQTTLQTPQQTALQEPTKPRFSHTTLKILYEQYKATMQTSSSAKNSAT
jgi:hypothetical protein